MANENDSAALSNRVEAARTQLDAHVREIVKWHFNPDTGCPFWLDFAKGLDWDPCTRVGGERLREHHLKSQDGKRAPART